MIWSMAALARRIAVIPVWDKESRTSHIQIQARPVQPLRVCQESREVAFKEYTPIIFNEKGDCVHVNLARDRICLVIPRGTCIPVPFFRFLCETQFVDWPGYNFYKLNATDEGVSLGEFGGDTQSRGEVTAALLKNGHDPDLGDRDGRTPLSWAAEGGHEAVLELLLEKGARPDYNDINGRTPLSWAIEGGNANAIQLLLAKDVEIDYRYENVSESD
jgi:hypothetical protein